MKTTRYPVDLRSTHDEWLALFEAAEHGDVDKDGRYDPRGAAINVWSPPWTTDATRHDAETIGTLYVQWANNNCIYQIEGDTSFDLADLLHELAVLEATALGYRKHGVKRFSCPRRCVCPRRCLGSTAATSWDRQQRLTATPWKSCAASPSETLHERRDFHGNCTTYSCSL
jgi:hypothetical protein